MRAHSAHGTRTTESDMVSTDTTNTTASIGTHPQVDAYIAANATDRPTAAMIAWSKSICSHQTAMCQTR